MTVSTAMHEVGTCAACDAVRRDRFIYSAQLTATAIGSEPEAQTGEAQRYATDSEPTVAACAQQEADGLSTG